MPLSRRVAAKTGTTTVNTTAAETELASLDLPAYALEGVGYSARLSAFGEFLNNTGGNDTVLIRVKLDDGTAATVLATPAVTLSTSANRRKWRLVVDIISVAASDSQRVDGLLVVSDPSTDSFSSGATDSLVLVGYGTATETTSAAISVDVTVTLGTSSANLEATCLGAILEALT